MGKPKKGSVVVLVGTPKSAFVLKSNARRRTWPSPCASLSSWFGSPFLLGRIAPRYLPVRKPLRTWIPFPASR